MRTKAMATWCDEDPEELNSYRPFVKTPERRLLAAVLGTVFNDMDIGNERAKQDALDWINSDEEKIPFTFLWIIAHLNLECYVTQIRVRVLAANESNKFEAEGGKRGEGILPISSRIGLTGETDAAIRGEYW